jgi:hypothetical protein
VRIDASLTDVRNKSDLSDFTGELKGRLDLRLTDRYNGGSAGGSQGLPATMADTPFEFGLPCSGTGDDTGSSCRVTTSANALLPGSVRDGDRAIWQLGAIGLYDPSGALFEKQGVFVP